MRLLKHYGKGWLAMGEHWPVLTIRQPWCWSIEHGGKPVENRGRYMKYRGPLWLHSGARSRWDPAGADSYLVQQAWLRYLTSISSAAIELAQRNYGLTRGSVVMRFGAVTSLAQVTGCHHAEECRRPIPRDAAGRTSGLCVPWAAWGQYHIELADVRPLPEPVPCRGMLGLWRLPDDVDAAVRAQLGEDGEHG